MEGLRIVKENARNIPDAYGITPERTDEIDSKVHELLSDKTDKHIPSALVKLHEFCVDAQEFAHACYYYGVCTGRAYELGLQGRYLRLPS